MRTFTLIFSAVIFLCGILTSAEGRNVYVNGVDITGAFNQSLNSVDVKIDDKGDIFIKAPHYQVNEEVTYLPLSQYEKNERPEHKTTPTPLSLPLDSHKDLKTEKSEEKLPVKTESLTPASPASPVLPSPSSEPHVKP